jgi:hypothetical protein
VRFGADSGAHGWAAAGSRELWTDLTVVCPVLAKYLHAAAAKRGAAAGDAGNHKRSKYRNDIPGFVFFLPLAFETEGYHTDDLGKLLLGFAHKRAAADGLEGPAAKVRARLWTDFWLDQFAMVHARFLARCVLNRAAACKDGVNLPFTRASFVDVVAASPAPPLPLPPCRRSNT